MIKIKEDFCKGCGYCILACPTKALKRSNKLNSRGIEVPLIEEEKCNRCHLCELSCPDFAITLEEE
jgi:2-oxoglutarate ferredoxin oxidoreductase subunit delta